MRRDDRVEPAARNRVRVDRGEIAVHVARQRARRVPGYQVPATAAGRDRIDRAWPTSSRAPTSSASRRSRGSNSRRRSDALRRTAHRDPRLRRPGPAGRHLRRRARAAATTAAAHGRATTCPAPSLDRDLVLSQAPGGGSRRRTLQSTTGARLVSLPRTRLRNPRRRRRAARCRRSRSAATRSTASAALDPRPPRLPPRRRERRAGARGRARSRSDPRTRRCSACRSR